ncbi:hypothetical protein [Synechococcus sp. ROS8604]|uniref:hypothetical protein n=1 Tax=Synechococcus sp. ROS8604 TaxID=1442557 RepID=UPI0016464F21|nr:hypothetical protein [Synechococcus sp. ROS8604]
MINTIKKVLGGVGIVAAVLFANEANNSKMCSEGQAFMERNQIAAESCQAEMYTSTAIALVVGGASLKVLLDKETWD